MAIEVSFTNDPSVVLKVAGGMLAREPVVHNLVLTLLHQRVAHPEPGRYWVVAEGDEPLGVVMQSPLDFPGTLTPMPQHAVIAAVDAIAAAGVELSGINGEAAVAARFAGQWAERTKSPVEPFNGQRIYELRAQPSSSGAPGHLRQAGTPDRDLIVEWMDGFAADIQEKRIETERLRRRVASGHFWLWDDDGPASVAACTEPVAGTTRIQAVYTPPPLRRQGYGGACVSALSAQLHTQGSRCILYADLRNPTSNALYRRIGFRAVVDCLRYRFDRSPGTPEYPLKI